MASGRRIVQNVHPQDDTVFACERSSVHGTPESQWKVRRIPENRCAHRTWHAIGIAVVPRELWKHSKERLRSGLSEGQAISRRPACRIVPRQKHRAANRRAIADDLESWILLGFPVSLRHILARRSTAILVQPTSPRLELPICDHPAANRCST